MGAATTPTTGGQAAKHKAGLAAARAEAVRRNPDDSAMQLAYEAGWLESSAELLATLLDKRDAELRPQPMHGHSLCAATFAGKPCALEYGTYQNMDGRACIELWAVWIRGERFEFGDQEVTDAQHQAWELACETAEGWHNSPDAADIDPPDWWANDEFAAAAAEDRFIAQRDHAHYARAA